MVEVFSQRKVRNPSYSLRAYARDLGVSMGLLSEVLGGKRTLTYRTGCKILPRLGLAPRREKQFVTSLAPQPKILPSTERALRAQIERLNADQFHLISDWYHFAILSLVKIPGCRADCHWISRRLGITPDEAELAVARLRRLRLVREENGVLKRTKAQIETTPDLPTSAIKKSHKQTLEQVIVALFDVPVDQREIISTTVATTPEKMSEAKRMIREFAETMYDFLDDGPKTEVYNFNMQLVPVTKQLVTSKENRE